MREIVLATYHNIEEARDAVRRLTSAGFDRSDIGFAVSDSAGEYHPYLNSDGADGIEEHDAEDGAEVGAVMGTIVGAVAGLFAITVPGIGPIIAAGPLAALGGAAAGSGIGAAAGAATGAAVSGLSEALEGQGVPSDDAQYYAESVRRGDVLVTVTTDNVAEAMNILNEHRPVNIDRRREQWMADGWERYDSTAEPYTAEELATFRDGYRRDYEADDYEYGTVRSYPYDGEKTS